MSNAQNYFARIGCAAGLLLLSSAGLAAQDKGCYDITPPRGGTATMELNIGAILLNKCTGETWFLFGSQADKGYVLRWRPIKKDEEEPVIGPPPSPPPSPSRR